MAKKTTDEESNAPISNIGARRERMQEGFERLFKLEQEKKDLEEEYLSEVKEEIKKEKKNISADCDVEAADWKLLFAIFKREKLAKEMESEEDRDRIIDNLKFAFSTLTEGHMVDFISVLDEANQKAA